MNSYYLVYDIGTTNIKAALFDEKGNLINIARKEIKNVYPYPGWAETKVSHIINQFFHVSQNLFSRYETSFLVNSITVVGNFPSLILIDDNGKFIDDRIILWMDRRAVNEANELWEKYNKPTGPEWPYAKLLWIKKNEPENFSRISKILQPQDLLIYQLTGNLISANNNLRVLGFNIEKNTWSEEGDYLGLGKKLVPPCVFPGTHIGNLQKEIAFTLKLNTGIPVVMGCGDADASVIGSGCMDHNDACEITGSSSVYSFVSSKKDLLRLPDPLFVFPHPLNDQSIIRAPISSSGLSIEWFRKNFTKEVLDDETAYELLFKEAEEAIGDDLVFLPHLTGRVSTKGYKTGFGTIANLRIEHTRGNLFRALLSSLAIQFSDLVSKTQEIGSKPEKIICSGRSSIVKFFIELKASACQIPLYILQTHETSLLGAALLAAKGIDDKCSWDTLRNRMIHIRNIIQPDDNTIEFLRDYRNSYTEIVNRL